MSEKARTYRIDALKLRQKTFDLYPPNSQARKMMIKKEQMNELNSLTLASTIIYPEVEINLLVEATKSELLDSSILTVMGFFGIGFLFGIKSIFPIESGLGLLSFYALIVGLVSWVTLKVVKVISGVFAIQKTTKARKLLKDRIKDLTNKIFGDI